MRPCTLRIASTESDIKATSLDAALVEHAPWCRTAPGALPIHIKPLGVAVVVRRGGAQDVRFLRDMLHHAYYWKERHPDAGPGPVQLYVKAWGRPGDTAMVALRDGFPVGAAWYRLFEAAAPGYGFIDPQTPELAVAVVPNARGKGVGSALLGSLLERARKDGYGALSLSVDRHNKGAIALYRQYGFGQVEETPDSLTLRAALA
jgi:ribosomal protein S18 acetylase RimI-like enzyme